MSNLHPTFAAILKPYTNRERFRVLESVHAELEAAGAVLDISQLDWAAKEITDRLYEQSLDRQYLERERMVEDEAIEKRSRDQQRARS